MVELAEGHALLKSLEINDKAVMNNLIEACYDISPDVAWELKINIGDKGLFRYKASISGSQ